MKKRMICICLLAVMLLGILAGCKEESTVLTQTQAQEIALKELGVTAEEAQIHIHTTTYEDKPCYSIYVTVGGKSHVVIIDPISGEVLHTGESSHSH